MSSVVSWRATSKGMCVLSGSDICTVRLLEATINLSPSCSFKSRTVVVSSVGSGAFLDDLDLDDLVLNNCLAAAIPVCSSMRALISARVSDGAI